MKRRGYVLGDWTWATFGLGLLLLVLGGVWPLGVVGQSWAREALEKSSRHHEWVAVKSGERTVHSFVVYPEVKEKAAVVIVIHENRGLTDWVRSVADQLGEAGYIAIAPDLLSGMAPGGGRTSDFPNEDGAREGIYRLGPDRVTSDLKAVGDYALKIPAGNGRVAVAGFCWGGMQSFRLATNDPRLKAAFVFYGTGPENAGDYRRIACPVYGFYGGNDARVNATIGKSEKAMSEVGKVYQPVVYEGAGHGFMRSGEEPGAQSANRKARDEAWKRWKELLRGL